jgi:hypothetical protein
MRFQLAKAVCVGAAFVMTFAMAGTADASRKKARNCGLVTGEGTAITEAIARANATMSLDQIATRVGGKRTGKVRMTCKKGIGGIIDTCQASQRLCK